MTDASPYTLTVTITREQVECWAGRPLSDDEIARLDECIPLSSIPDAVAGIVSSFEPDEDDEAADEQYRWTEHSNDIGDWCPWSGGPTTADPSDDDHRCPARCAASSIEPVDD
jgi:hypothetical protein